MNEQSTLYQRFLAVPQACLGIAFGFGTPVADRCNLHDVLRGIHAAQDAGQYIPIEA